MSRTRFFTLIALFATLAPASFALHKTNVRIVPQKGEKLNFARVYSAEHLKDHPLQLVTKTDFTLSNTRGLLTGKWKATVRDLRTDELTQSEATGLCKPHGQSRVECAFDADAGTVFITAKNDGALVSIPVGQGVRFDQKKDDGLEWAEFLMGNDDDNNLFKVFSKKN